MGSPDARAVAGNGCLLRMGWLSTTTWIRKAEAKKGQGAWDPVLVLPPCVSVCPWTCSFSVGLRGAWTDISESGWPTALACGDFADWSAEIPTSWGASQSCHQGAAATIFIPFPPKPLSTIPGYANPPRALG